MVPGERPRRVLVVEDEPRYARLLALLLEREGYQVATASSAAAALEQATREPPDLVVLDLGLPDADGLQLCRQLREFSDLAIIVLTARAGLDDRVLALDLGADDYLTKPFAPEELLARTRAVLRRTGSERAAPAPPVVRCGELEVDFVRGTVTLGGRELALSPTEYRLLRLFVQESGRLLVPDQVLERVWGPGYRGEHHLVRMYVSRLRKKLGDSPEQPRYIETRPGIGYRFRCPPA
ncbi:MAG: response regulator transcription factor [Chloroflexi bacterium]|nr:response regulator transcription factor [Chloroflexota bacterium]